MSMVAMKTLRHLVRTGKLMLEGIVSTLFYSTKYRRFLSRLSMMSPKVNVLRISAPAVN